MGRSSLQRLQHCRLETPYNPRLKIRIWPFQLFKIKETVKNKSNRPNGEERLVKRENRHYSATEHKLGKLLFTPEFFQTRKTHSEPQGREVDLRRVWQQATGFPPGRRPSSLSFTHCSFKLTRVRLALSWPYLNV